MPVDRIFIARHGFRSSWGSNVKNTTTGTIRDVELSSYGVKQAVELAEFLQDKNIEAVFASPWYRTVQTAAITAQRLNLPVCLETGIAEWFLPVVPHTGLHPFPRDANFLKRFFPSIDVKYSSPIRPNRRGETREELRERLRRALHHLLKALDDQGDQCPRTIFLVGHAATVPILGKILTDDWSLEVRTGCCSLSSYSRKSSGWICDFAGRADFLSGGEERHWSFEDIDGQTDEEGVGEGVDDDLDEKEQHMPIPSTKL